MVMIRICLKMNMDIRLVLLMLLPMLMLLVKTRLKISDYVVRTKLVHTCSYKSTHIDLLTFQLPGVTKRPSFVL